MTTTHRMTVIDERKEGKTMERRRVLGIIWMLLVALAMVTAPSVDARERRCRSDKQCRDGTCNTAGRCCNTFAGEVACGATCCDTLVEGTMCCGDGCANVASDNANCGGCGNVCSGGHQCEDGACVCPEGTTQCGAECVDTTFDNLNCGSCGNVCGEGQECVDSVCKCTSNGQPPCNGTCLPPTQQCCTWSGNTHTCPADQQCAGNYCCGAGTAICVSANGYAQCCDGALVCQSGRCCVPGADCVGNACCINQ
jgi:hypothetical protein